MSNIEYEAFKNYYLQHPITFLTEENLDKLETHCRKAINYERGVEHQVVLELLERHKEHLAEREQDKKRIKELEEENKIYVLNGDNVKLELYIKENYIPVQKVKDKIEEYFEDEEWLIEHDLKALCDDEKECREYYINKKIALKDIKKNILDKLNKLLNNY